MSRTISYRSGALFASGGVGSDHYHARRCQARKLIIKSLTNNQHVRSTKTRKLIMQVHIRMQASCCCNQAENYSLGV